MSVVPATVGKHLDAIEIRENGSLLLASSSLTYRYWTGSLWNYKNADLAPDVEKCDTGVEIDAGVQDLKCIRGTEKLVVASDNGAVQLWELSEGGSALTCLAQPLEHDGIVNTVSVNADQSRVASAAQDGNIKVWDLDEFTSVNTFRAHTDIVTSATFHPQQNTVLVSTSQDGSMLLWDLRKPKPATRLTTTYLPSSATCLAWQPAADNGVVVGTQTGHISLLDLRQLAEPCLAVKAHGRRIHRLVFCPQNAAWFASASEDCSVVVTEYTGGCAAPIYRDDTHQDFVQGLAWHPDGRLFSASWDFSVRGRQVTPNLEKAQDPVEEVTNKLREKVEMDTTSEEAGSGEGK